MELFQNGISSRFRTRLIPFSCSWEIGQKFDLNASNVEMDGQVWEGSFDFKFKFRIFSCQIGYKSVLWSSQFKKFFRYAIWEIFLHKCLDKNVKGAWTKDSNRQCGIPKKWQRYHEIFLPWLQQFQVSSAYHIFRFWRIYTLEWDIIFMGILI